MSRNACSSGPQRCAAAPSTFVTWLPTSFPLSTLRCCPTLLGGSSKRNAAMQPATRQHTDLARPRNLLPAQTLYGYGTGHRPAPHGVQRASQLGRVGAGLTAWWRPQAAATTDSTSPPPPPSPTSRPKVPLSPWAAAAAACRWCGGPPGRSAHGLPPPGDSGQ